MVRVATPHITLPGCTPSNLGLGIGVGRVRVELGVGVGVRVRVRVRLGLGLAECFSVLTVGRSRPVGEIGRVRFGEATSQWHDVEGADQAARTVYTLAIGRHHSRGPSRGCSLCCLGPFALPPGVMPVSRCVSAH